MPARSRLPAPVAVAGAPPIATIEGALSLLAFIADHKGRGAAADILKAMVAASEANAEAVAAFGPIGEIEQRRADAEVDRSAAAEELERARAEAKRLVADVGDRVAAGSAELAAERRRLDERAADLTAAEQGLAERQAAFARETAGLRAALAG